MVIAERLRMLRRTPPAAANDLSTTREGGCLSLCDPSFEIGAIAQPTEIG